LTELESRELLAVSGVNLAAGNAAVQHMTYQALVDGLYQDILNRNPDPAGEAAWINSLQRQNGRNADAVTRAFLNSAERLQLTNSGLGNGTGTGTGIGTTTFMAFGNSLHSITEQAFVDGLYHDVLGRPSDPGGAAFWMNVLQRGYSFNVVTRAFMNSPEAQQLSTYTGIAGNLTSDQLGTVTTAFGNGAQYGLTGNDVANVVGLYQTILNRNPTQTEVNNELRSLSQGTSLGVIRNQLMNSSQAQQFLNTLGVNGSFTNNPQAAQSFISNLYQTIDQTQPDANGLAYYSQLLVNGTNPNAILPAFLGSSAQQQYLFNQLSGTGTNNGGTSGGTTTGGGGTTTNPGGGTTTNPGGGTTTNPGGGTTTNPGGGTTTNPGGGSGTGTPS
jgi:hypothetical protein